MASSKIDHETGIVTITTPGAGCSVGDRFYVVGHGGEFAYTFPDWLQRIVTPHSQNGNAYNVGVDSAEAELALAVRLGLVHESLVVEPGELAA
jgi:hypothetical protein